jgi:hypothetical protein
MSKTKYMTKFQLEHLKQRVSNEIDPLIEEAQLLQKSIVANLTESAELKLAKKIKADVVIKELENAFQSLEIAQRKAQTFFSKNATSSTLKENLNYRFKDKQEGIIKTGSYRGNSGITPADCREQLREWASTLANKEAEKTEEGQKVKKLKLYKQSAINQIFAHRAPRSTVKLFASSEINNLLTGIDKAAPLAVDDYKLITKILINQKN